MSDIFGDRMKLYESAETGKFMPLLPICVRLDGRSFSKFTKGLARPYDERLSVLMRDTMLYLVQESGACIGYTQSDEISLVFWEPKFDSQVFFGGKKQRIVSVLSSMATAFFNNALPMDIPENAGLMPVFDCRAWQVPNLEEAANVFLWRELDAVKNSVSMAAREYYSHKQLMNLGRSDQMELLFKAGVNWNDYPVFFKRGIYAQRRKTYRKFNAQEIERLPELHEARKNPDLEIERTDVVVLDMPAFSKVTNRVGVIFMGEDPIVDSMEESE